MGLKGPRMMKVYLPGVDSAGRMKICRPLNEKEYLQNIYKRNNETKEVYVVENKQPVWSTKYNSHMMDFGFRVTQASPKNFQLIDPRNRKNV
jgi:tubby-related protein 1